MARSFVSSATTVYGKGERRLIESPWFNEQLPRIGCDRERPDAGGVDGYGPLFRQGGDQLGLLVKDIGAPPCPAPIESANCLRRMIGRVPTRNGDLAPDCVYRDRSLHRNRAPCGIHGLLCEVSCAFAPALAPIVTLMSAHAPGV